LNTIVIDDVDLIDGGDVGGEPETVKLRYVQDCYSLFSKNSGFSIFHLNIRSLKRNFDQFVVLLESLKIKFDCIVLSETWDVDDINHFAIDGYNAFYNHSHYNQNDGVVVFVRSELCVDVTYDSVNNLTFTNARITFYDKIISILAIYRPPAYEVISFLGRLESYLDKNLNSQINVLIGDINIDLLKTDREAVDMYTSMLGYRGFVSLINSPTRVTQESETCIDHIFLKIQNSLCSKSTPIVFHSDITDHYSILANFEISLNVNNNNSNKTFKTTDIQKLNKTLEAETWASVYCCDNLNDAFDNFSSILKKHIDNSSKVKQIQTKVKKIKPWITLGLITSMNRRDKMKKQLLKYPSVQLGDEYRVFRNTLSKLISKQKYSYYSAKIDSAGSDLKRVWNTIKDVIGGGKNKTENICLEENGEKINDPEIISNKLNEYFIRVAECSIYDNTNSCNNSSEFAKKDTILNSMFLEAVTEKEVNNIIIDLRNGSSAGGDGISVDILKNCREYLLSPLVYLINNSFTFGEFPRSLKTSVITPIYKKSGNREDANNYRPISVTSQISKIFEKAIVTRLNSHFEKHNVISHRQFGFRKNLSTQDALYFCFKNIYNSINLNNKTIAIFLDLRKAFDTVAHGLLMERLEQYGIRGSALNLIGSFLYDRRQVVKVGNVYSRPLKVESGVPQGTVLGPIMFIAYINELLRTDVDGEIITYADDTALLFSDVTWTGVKQKAEVGIKKVVAWLSQHKLSLNVAKTRFMPFFASPTEQINFNFLTVHNLSCPQACQCNLHITVAHELKYLGLIVDSRLRWVGHISYLTKKLKPFLFIFYQLRYILNRKTLITTYKLLIESIVQYGIIIWGGTFKTLLNPLYIRQKYLIKLILFKNKLYSTKLVYAESGLLDIQCLYILKSCVFTKKSLELREHVNHPFNTRNRLGGTLVVPRMRTTMNQRFITYLGPKIYNSVSQNFKQINNPSMFSKKLYSHLSLNREYFLSLL